MAVRDHGWSASIRGSNRIVEHRCERYLNPLTTTAASLSPDTFNFSISTPFECFTRFTILTIVKLLQFQVIEMARIMQELLHSHECDFESCIWIVKEVRDFQAFQFSRFSTSTHAIELLDICISKRFDFQAIEF